MDQEGLISAALFVSAFRGATPLILAAMGGFLSERSGTVQIGLEGMMLAGALAGATHAHFHHAPWVSFFVAGCAGMLLAFLLAIFVISIRIDQIVAGAALNMLAFGIAPFVTKQLFDSTGSTPSLPLESRFTFGPIVVSIAVAVLITFWYRQTRSGLLLRFAGERPEALAAAGYKPQMVKWWGLLGCGFLAGLGGGSLSLFLSSSYSPSMTGGRGFIALAALIFGRWKPFPTMCACLFFAFVDAIQMRLQGQETGIPIQFIQILPYLVTIIALAGFFGKSRAPQALGQRP